MSELGHQITLAWWTWIAPLSVQAAVVILLVAVIDRLLPHRTWPELRAALWTLALLRLVLPPDLASPLSLTRFVPEIASIAAVPLDVVDGEVASVVWWANAAVVAWSAGVLLLTTFGLARYRRLRGLWLRDSTTDLPDDVEAVVEKTAERLGLRRPPRVRLSAAVRSPFVTGLFRPVVFLPADIVEQVEPEQLEHVLLHELAHVRRRDVWLSAACTAVQILYWFHPLVWLANSRLATIREQCCDRSVARLLKDSTEDYRHTLMCLARRLLDDPAAGRIGFLSPESVILARLRLLEGGAGKASRLRRPAVTAVMIVMLVALLPMARTADDGIESVAEIIERPPGCLQLRFLVLERLAEEQQEQRGGVR